MKKLPLRKVQKVARGERRPAFDSMFNPAGMANPLDAIEYTGDVETDAATEISATLKAIIEQKRAMREVYRTTTDPEFWFAVCFQSREQKDEFLRLAGWGKLGDKYLDGLKVASQMDIPLDPVGIKAQGSKLTPVTLRDVKIITKGGDG